jgi:hypothetical protein
MALTAMRGRKRKSKIQRIAGRLNDDMKHYGGLPLFNDNMTDEEFEKEFKRSVNMYACVGTRQERSKAAKAYVKQNHKKDFKHFSKLPESLICGGLGTFCRVWEFSGKFTESGQEWVTKEVARLVEHAKSIQIDEVVVLNVPSPIDRMRNKVYNTIIRELEEVEEAWMNGEKAEINLFERCQVHGIKANSVNIITEWLEPRVQEYDDAITKKDEDAVEFFSHLKKPELKRQFKVLTDALADCERVKSASKATRKTRVKKPQAADKQVAKLKFMKDNNEFKVASVNPLLIVGASRVILFNTKNKRIEEYQTDRPDGFEVKGQSLQHVNRSRGKTLRKPEEFLPIALKKTPKQFEKEFNNLTTKEYNPNARFNDSIIILLAK